MTYHSVRGSGFAIVYTDNIVLPGISSPVSERWSGSTAESPHGIIDDGNIRSDLESIIDEPALDPQVEFRRLVLYKEILDIPD